MDSPITTSFIPKTRLTAASRQRPGIGFGLGLLVSGFILLVSLGLFGGVYFYKQSLQKQIDEAVVNLERAKKAFEPGLITELTNLTGSVNAAKQIFSQHQASSKLLKLIGDLSLKEVTFTTFTYGASGNDIIVSMNGDAKSYTTVALQTKLLEDSDFIDTVSISNLALKEAGRVNFSVKLTIKYDFLIYKL